uniref:Uncharacterized protein n=1 Tax=Oryza sativa subsp. japonica TaxID=39947 RepID=Q6K5Y2_ORYSJ|nr:hypothetical protein [Oryza sativa Japonica Group]
MGSAPSWAVSPSSRTGVAVVGRRLTFAGRGFTALSVAVRTSAEAKGHHATSRRFAALFWGETERIPSSRRPVS